MKSIYQKAFTLVEILIVVVILAIIAAAVLIAINPTKKINATKDSVAKSDLGQIVNALQTYYANPSNNYEYPLTDPGLTALIPTELKSLPQQQAGYTVCPDSPNGGATPSSANYCYVVSDTGDKAAVWGTLFSEGTAVWCWDSTAGIFRSEASASNIPTQESPICPLGEPTPTPTQPPSTACNVQNKDVSILYIPTGTPDYTWHNNIIITLNLPSDATELNLRITQVNTDDNSARIWINDQLVVDLYLESDEQQAHSVAVNANINTAIKPGSNTVRGSFYDRYGGSASLGFVLNGSYKTGQACSISASN